MKINNTSNIPPTSDDGKTDLAAPKPDQPNSSILHPPSPEDSTTINRTNNTRSTAPDNEDFDSTLPAPIDLAHYAATGSLHALRDKLLAAAEQILLTMPDNPVLEARNQVIDLVLKENFRNVITGNEQHEIADTLKRALGNDPIFCSEVDNMLEIAARKLKLDEQS